MMADTTHRNLGGSTRHRLALGSAWSPGRVVFLLMVLALAGPVSTAELATLEDALARAYPGAEALAITPTLEREQAAAVMAASEPQARGKLGATWLAHRDGQLRGVAFVDHVIGRTEFITYLCALGPDGAVARIEILTYREPYGGEIAARSWLERFEGRTHGAPLRLKREVPNIAGATLSCRAVTERVRFLLAFHDLVVARQVPGLLPARTGGDTGSDPVHRSEIIGEPSFTLTVRGEGAAEAAEAAIDAARRVDDALNVWRPDSGLAGLVAAGGGAVDTELSAVLDLATELHAASDGAFDPTIKPVVELWADAVAAGHPPDAQAIATRLATCGFDRIAWRPGAATITIPDGLALDCSALHKGAAVQRAAETLAAAGCSGLVDFGGSSWAAVGEAQTIALRDPLDPEALWTQVELPAGRALATSSGGGRRWRIAGEAVGHLIDARDGRPVPAGRAAAVIATDAALADGLATTCCLLDETGVRLLLERYDDAAALLRREDGSELRLGPWPAAEP